MAGSRGRRPISRTPSSAPSDDAPAERRRRLLYGRRKGPKLSAHQTHLRETLLPQLSVRLQSGADPRSYFSSSVDDVWLETGFGAGEHLLWQAQQHPNIGLIGAEPYESGVAKLLSRIPDGMPNIRLHEGDARDIIEALPDASIGRFFILFPDPWPKVRHHKRRFIQMEMLDQLARILKPGAELRFATDDRSYLPYALERLMAHPKFAWTAQHIADWISRPADWPQTRYEAKAIKGPPVFLRFKRR
ncbi:MAG TPA: tRNA (guanine(46)-N(7))-methyltransferase TrmB [Rhizomicrobium sp.]|nr:tRNA (guanine(46)-N(7))-methyltransferase TrmB [Rhizomicrobium sp.]